MVFLLAPKHIRRLHKGPRICFYENHAVLAVFLSGWTDSAEKITGARRCGNVNEKCVFEDKNKKKSMVHLFRLLL